MERASWPEPSRPQPDSPTLTGRLHGRRPPLPAPAVRGRRRAGPRRPGPPQRDPAESRHPRLPVQRHPGRRQDVDRPDLRQVPELRARGRPRSRATPATSARRSRSARTSTSSRSTGPATTASRRSASSGRTPASGPAAPGSRSTTSTKSTCSRPGAFNALLEDARGAARARQVPLRDDRAEQDPDHRPLALPAVRLRRDHARPDRRVAGRDLPARGRRGRPRGAAGHRPAGGGVDAGRAVAPGTAPLGRRRPADGRAGPPAARHRQRRADARPARAPWPTATPPRSLALVDQAVGVGRAAGRLARRGCSISSAT